MPAPAKLNEEMILTEAIALLRDEGLDEVTLRKLAVRLGVEAPSLYRHIGGKPQLLALVTLRLFRMQIDSIGTCTSWQEWLTKFGHVLWETQVSIEDCARLVLTTRFEPHQFDTMAGWVADALDKYGIEQGTALEMQLAVQAVVLGLAGSASGPNGQYLCQIIPFSAIAKHALDALVAGWEARLPEGAGRLPHLAQ